MAIIQMSDPVYFNGTSLQSITGLRITGTDTFRNPTRDLQNLSIASSDFTATTSGFFTEHKINVRTVIARSGRELLDESIGELKRILYPINKTLQLPIAGEQRKYLNVSVANIGFSDVAGGYAAVDIEFVTSDPCSYSLTSSEILNVVNLTSGDKSYPIIFSGTAKQKPIITYTVDSFTPSTSVAVTFSNPTDGTSIEVSRTWTTNDVLVIDNLAMTVKVNGTAVDFTGNFLEWDNGNGFINYADDFTTRQVDINVTNTKRNL